MEKYVLLTTDLTLFDGAAAPAGGEGGEAGAQAETVAGPGGSRRGNAGEKVVYGKTAETGDGGEPSVTSSAGDTSLRKGGGPAGDEGPDAGAQEHTPTPKERRAAFEKLIGEDYKDLFEERTQKIIDRRFKAVKGLEGQVQAAQPILDMLSQRYGVEGGDPAKLAQAMEADDAYWAEAAQSHGMTAQQYREYTKLQRENEAFRKAAQQQQGAEAARQQLEAWHREAAEVQGAYPGFDLAAECADAQFLSMLRAGVPMRHAYEVRHLDDIKTGVAAQVSKQTEKQVTETIRAKGARPAENGVAGTAGILVKSDPSKLSRADRAEIARRVARGENIAF